MCCVEVKPRQLIHYHNATGDTFERWFRTIPKPARARILVKLGRVKNGNLGDTRSVGEGISELEIDFANGYRIYFGQDGDQVVLLTGGTKDSQQRNIQLAKSLWRERRG